MRVTPIERSQIKAVIIEAHKPDTTFRTNAEIRTNARKQGIPIELIILIIRSILWRCRDKKAYTWFVQHHELGISLSELARRAGICRNSHDIITRRMDAMVDDGVDHMPNYLANKIIDIFGEHLKGGTYRT